MNYFDFINELYLLGGKLYIHSQAVDSYYNKLLTHDRIDDPVSQIVSSINHFGIQLATQRLNLTSVERNSLHIGITIPGALAFALNSLNTDWCVTICAENGEEEKENIIFNSYPHSNPSLITKEIRRYDPYNNQHPHPRVWSLISIAINKNDNYIQTLLKQEISNFARYASIIVIGLPGMGDGIKESLESYGFVVQHTKQILKIEISLYQNINTINEWKLLPSDLTI